MRDDYPNRPRPEKSVRWRRNGVKIAAATLLVAACAFGCGRSEPKGMLIELHWDNDADLDLELWRVADSSGDTVVRPAATEPGGREGVTGRSGESCRFDASREKGMWRVVVRYWAPGPSKDTTAHVTARVTDRSGRAEEMSAEIDDDSHDLWFPFEISAPDGKVTRLGLVGEGGI